MSKESWLFLFAALGGIGGLGTIAQFWLQIHGTVKATNSKRNSVSLAMSKTRLVVITGLLILSLICGVTGFAFSLQSRDSHPTKEATEKNVKAWLDDLRASVRVEQRPSDLDFLFTASTGPGIFFTVGKPKEGLFENYLMVNSLLQTTAHDQAMFDALNEQKAFVRMVDDIEMEAARSKTAFFIKEKPLTMRLEKRLPITGALTEDVFIQSVNELLNTSFLLRVVVNKTLHENGLK